MQKVREYLDLTATTVMIVTSAVLVWHVVSDRASPRSAPAAGYSQGDVFGAVEGVRFTETPATAILFVQSTCQFCSASMPFYRRLSALPRRAKFIVMGVETRDQLKAYLSAQQLKADDVVSVNGQNIKFRGTPTLLLVDNKGVVRDVWAGQLDNAREEAVLKKIGS
jgi:hypothetical protein